MFTSKKDFSLLRYGGLPILMSLLLILAIGASSVQAQSVDTIAPAPAKLVVKLQNKAVQDSVVMPAFKIVFSDSLLFATTDSIAMNFQRGFFTFAQSGPYPVVASNANYTVDSARVNSAGNMYIKITGPRAGTSDTLTISGVYIKGIGQAVPNDSSAVDSLHFQIGHTGTTLTAGTHNGAGECVLLPGPIYNAAITVQPGTTNTAGSSITANPVLALTDKFGGVPSPSDSVATISVAAVLSNGTSQGNGTLSGTSTITRTTAKGNPGTLTYTYTGLKYTKAETIRLTFTPPSGTMLTSQAAGIAVSPGTAKNISAVLHTGSSDAITVDQTISYDVTVTDQYFNPVGNTTGQIGVSEATAHGGTVDSTAAGAYSTINGAATIKFIPSKFFVGADTLVFVSPSTGTPTATYKRAITIGAGGLGGIIVDYAGTANGTAAGYPGGSSEKIAAGVTAYVRVFLRDTYGNPIDATSASQATFTNTGKTGVGTALGTSALTTSVSESQYPNTYKSAIGVAIPYTVSTNLTTGTLNRTSIPDSILVTVGTYTSTVTIQSRSNIPATVKLQQSVAGDSSLVASNYANSTTYVDTVWDVYGNLCSNPGTVKIAPLKAAYGMFIGTMGNGKFVGTSTTSDTTVADTLYPSSGAVTRTIASSKVAGLDTIKTWSLGNSSVVASAPLWITPAAFAKIAITPHVDTTAVAGKVDYFQVEKKDTYGNHIDWGLAGATQKGNSPAANFLVPTTAQIQSDSSALVTDTVSTGHNRGGKVAKVARIGTAGVASVNGSLNFQIKYTPYNVTADTQKIYALLTYADTVQVRSIPTGPLSSFTVTIAAADSSKNAGDSVKVTIKAFDNASTPNQIYSYGDGGQTFSITNTSVPAVTSKDSTWYFTYVNTRGQYVKSTGAAIADTVFAQGQAILYLHKFASEGSVVNKVTITAITAGSITATSTNGSKFAPLTSVAQTTWTITAPDTVTVGTIFNYTITPRDMYRNINLTATNFAYITSDQGVNFDAGANPKIFAGPTSYTATQKVINGTLTITVSNGSTVVNGQSKAIVVIPAVVNVSVSGTVAYASAAANAIGGATVTLTPATGTALTAVANASGAYSIAAVPAGTYTLTASKTGNWGGVSSTDALLIAKHSAGITLLTGLPLQAGDVNANGAVNNTDALLIVLRVVGTNSSFTAGDWTFQSQTVTVGTTNVTANISGLCVGDVNASYVPASGTAFTKSPASISLKNGSDKLMISGASAADLGAVTMKINVNTAKVASISSKLPGFVSRVDDEGVVSFGWFAKDGQAVHFNANEAIVTVTLDKKASDNSSVTISSDLADLTGAAIENSLAVSTKDIPTAFALSQNYPNPFNPSTQINYDLPQAGMVTLSVYNMLGQEVGKLVNEQKEAGSYTVTWAPHNLASGVYIYRIHVQTEKDSYTSVKRLTLLK